MNAVWEIAKCSYLKFCQHPADSGSRRAHDSCPQLSKAIGFREKVNENEIVKVHNAA